MKKSKVVGLVTGAHVVAFGGLMLTQGCGTTRAPLPREDEFVMPPHEEQVDEVRPVPVEPVRRPEPMPPRQDPQPVTVTPPAETTTYTVVAGDALSVIARRYGVSMQEIMRLNNISDPDTIRVGQRLELPGRIDIDQPRDVTRREAAPAREPVEGGRYVVQSGDSLSVIAHRHGVSQQALMRANNITDPDRIQVGQELVLPGVETPVQEAPTPEPQEQEPAPTVDEQPVPSPTRADEPEATALPPAPASPAGAQTHTIEIGDDLLSVASEYNVSIADLREANDLDSDILVPGRVLIIPDVD